MMVGAADFFGILLVLLFLHIVPHAEDAMNSVQEGNLKTYQ
jgi:hypothetical protein